MGFAENLKRLRKEKGISRAEIAKTLNMTENAFGTYERGEREPPIEKLCRIADTLHVTTDELLGHKLDKYETMYSYLQNMGATIKKNDDSISIGFPLSPDSHGSTGEQFWVYQTEEGLYIAVQKAINTMEKETRTIQKRFLMEQFSNDGKNEIKKIYPEYAKAIERIFPERSTNHE